MPIQNPNNNCNIEAPALTNRQPLATSVGGQAPPASSSNIICAHQTGNTNYGGVHRKGTLTSRLMTSTPHPPYLTGAKPAKATRSPIGARCLHSGRLNGEKIGSCCMPRHLHNKQELDGKGKWEGKGKGRAKEGYLQLTLQGAGSLEGHHMEVNDSILLLVCC